MKRFHLKLRATQGPNRISVTFFLGFEEFTLHNAGVIQLRVAEFNLITATFFLTNDIVTDYLRVSLERDWD